MSWPSRPDLTLFEDLAWLGQDRRVIRILVRWFQAQSEIDYILVSVWFIPTQTKLHS